MKTDRVYFVECGSRCGLLEAPNISDARRQANDEFGRNNGPTVRAATAKDVGWVGNMGGFVPAAAERLRRPA